MWNDFDGRPYSREEFLALLDDIPVEQLSWVRLICAHNTAAPSLKQWMSGAATPAQRIVNLQHFYENERGWRSGPHGFIPPSETVCIYGFTRMTVPGVHASCFNKNALGFELVGDFDSEEFMSGPGALVRSNAIFVFAAIYNRLGLRPDGFELGKSGLHFHIDCKRDNHACPGKKVDRAALVRDVLAEMARQTGEAPAVANGHDPSVTPSLAPVTIPVDVPTVTATVPEPRAGFMDRIAPNAAKAEELVQQGSRIAQPLKNLTAMFWKFWGVVLTLLGLGSQVDPNKGPAQAAGSWASQHPFLLALLCVGVTALIITGYAYWKAKQAEKGLASAAKDGRYLPRGAAA